MALSMPKPWSRGDIRSRRRLRLSRHRFIAERHWPVRRLCPVRRTQRCRMRDIR